MYVIGTIIFTGLLDFPTAPFLWRDDQDERDWQYRHLNKTIKRTYLLLLFFLIRVNKRENQVNYQPH